MAIEKVGGRTVRLPNMSGTDFRKLFPNPDKSLITSRLSVPVFNGETFPGENGEYGRGQVKLTTTVDFGRAVGANPDMAEVLGIDPSRIPDTDFHGNTPSGRPIDIRFSANMSDNSGKDNLLASITMDNQAVSSANDKARDQARQAKGLPEVPAASRGRIAVRMQTSNAVDGVAGVSPAALNRSVAEGAAESYLLTASKSDPSKGLPGKKDIEAVGKLYADTLADFASTYADTGCNGIPAMVKDDKGGYRPGTRTVEGTSFPSLSEMGIGVTKMPDGSTVLPVVDQDRYNEANRSGNIRSFNQALNTVLSQKANAQFSGPEDGVARQLASQMDFNAYAVSPRGSGMRVIQPALVTKISPYAGSLTRAMEFALHQEPEGSTPESAYGKEILSNVKSLHELAESYGPEKGRSREAAEKVQSARLDAIRKATPDLSGPAAGRDSEGISFSD